MYVYAHIEFSLSLHFIKNMPIETTHKPWSKYYDYTIFVFYFKSFCVSIFAQDDKENSRKIVIIWT